MIHSVPCALPGRAGLAPSPRRMAVAAGILIGVLAATLGGARLASAGEGPVPRIYYEAIADGSPALAVGEVPFKTLPAAPVIDGDTVYFAGTLTDGRSGIYRRRGGLTEACADTGTAIPGGRGTFSRFEGEPAAEGGRLVFRASGAGAQQGVYLLADGRLRRVADTSTLAPDGKSRFVALGAAAFFGPDVVFLARPEGAKVTGLYRADAATGAVTAVADASMRIPGRDAHFGDIGQLSSSGGRVMFSAQGPAKVAGVYALTAQGLETLVDTQTPRPGAPDDRFAGFENVVSDRSGETSNVAFLVPPPKGGPGGGIYARIDGALQIVGEVSPAGTAHGSSTLNRFEAPSIHRDRVYCVAHSAEGTHAIFSWRAGKRFPLTHRDVALGGRKPVSLAVASAAVGASGLVFQASFEDGTQGIFLAHLRMDSGRVVLSDTLHGRSNGEVTGGRYVEGGGWTAVNPGDRIVWKLPPMARNGMLEVDIRNFDPKNQATADRNIFMGLWGNLFRNFEHFGLPGTDNWEIRVGRSVEQFKIEYHARGFGKAAHWAPFNWPFDPNHNYRFRVEWREGHMSTWVDDRVLHFDGFEHEPLDAFQFLHIGTSPAFGAQVTVGPIYSNVRVVSFD